LDDEIISNGDHVFEISYIDGEHLLEKHLTRGGKSSAGD
jgi:hypothetical protein